MDMIAEICHNCILCITDLVICTYTPAHESPHVKTRPLLRIGTLSNSRNGIIVGENRRRVLLNRCVIYDGLSWAGV